MIKLLANVIWFIFGGIFLGLAWLLLGFLLCITIIGIPFGLQCFKAAKISFFPFGKRVQIKFGSHPIANTVWIICAGWWMALIYLAAAIINFITIIGIPNGTVCLKLMKIAFCPFGSEVIRGKRN